MKFKQIFGAVCLSALLYGCGTSPDDLIVAPGIYFNTNTLDSSPTIDITSKSDKAITIEKVILNKGNCNVLGKAGSSTLGYGKTLQVLYKNCNIINVEIQTDQGHFEYSFDR